MTTKRLVLDANILIRAVLGRRVPDLLVTSAQTVAFCAPSASFSDAHRHLPAILERRGIAVTDLTLGLNAVHQLVEESPKR